MFITQKEKRKKICLRHQRDGNWSKYKKHREDATWNSFRIYPMHRQSSLGTFMPCLLVEESNSSWQTGHCCSCMYSLTSKINSWIVSWIGKKWIEYCTLQVNCTYLRGRVNLLFQKIVLVWNSFYQLSSYSISLWVMVTIYLLDRSLVKLSKLKTIWSSNFLSNK